MNEQLRNFTIGLAAVLGLIGIAVLLMFFGEWRFFRPDQYEISIDMTMAAGIREGSPIELSGVRIGQVERIFLRPEEIEFPVRAIAVISQDKRIPENVTGSVDRSLLAGTAILQLVTHPLQPDEVFTYVPDDGSGRLYIDARPFFDQMLAELDARTEPLLEALDSFTRLSETFVAVGENVNALIGEQFDTDIDEPTLRAALIRLNTTLDQAKDMFARYERLADAVEHDAAVLVQSLLPVTDELAGAFAEIRRITSLAAEGSGTVAQLLNNPDLYESLLDSSIRLERALMDAQLLIQKFQTEGLPIRW